MQLVSVVRVSTSGQDTEGQVPANRKWAAANGHTIVRVVEIKASAFKVGTDDKPTPLDRELAAILATEPEGIVMRRLDRLSRQGIERGLSTIRRIREAGVKLYFADMGDSAEINELVAAALFHVAAEESRVKSERTRDNHAIISSRDAWSGLAAFGYRTAGTGELNARLEVSEAEASVVREMFQWCAEGASTREIAAWLTDRALTPRGNAWSQAQVRKMLNHEAYATGVTTLTSTPRKPNGKPDVSRRITWDHKHAPIIDRALFDAAHASLADRRNRITYTRDDTLEGLEGALTCSKCSKLGKPGQRLYIARQHKHGKTYQRYQCRVGHGMTRSKAEAAVAERMQGHLTVNNVTVTPDRADPTATALAEAKADLARTNPATAEGRARTQQLWDTIDALEAEVDSQDAATTDRSQTLVWLDATGYATSDWAERRRLVREAGINIP